MSSVIATYESEPTSAFDWHHQDIINKPPYDHYNMVVSLAEGAFLIEGRQSDETDAQLYADYHEGEPDVFKALEDIAAHEVRLAIDGIEV